MDNETTGEYVARASGSAGCEILIRTAKWWRGRWTGGRRRRSWHPERDGAARAGMSESHAAPKGEGALACRFGDAGGP